MFGRLFRKPHIVQGFEQPLDGVRFIEPVQGTGLDSLRMELAARLLPNKQIENAFLPKLKYPSEKSVRTCLILVEHEPLTNSQREGLAATCAGIIPLDILYAQDLPISLLSSIRSMCRPLYLPELALFECPLLIRRGTNQGMPAAWPLGMSFWWVAARNHEDALLHAVGSAKAIGFEFVDLYKGTVVQLDHKKWWDEVVMKQWHEYSAHLPTQEQIELILVTGGVVMGPNLGPVAASDA